MAQWTLIINSIVMRCITMWNFLLEIPKCLTRRVSALSGQEAQADIMQCGASSRTRIQAERSARGVKPIFFCLIGIGTLSPVVVVFAVERCPATNATKVVSVQGNVTWNVINNAALQSAKLDAILCVGDTVRVGAKSRAVLRLPNETTVPLDQNTIFQLKQAISEKDPTLIELLQGAIHVITRTPKPFKVETPYLNALVEGTEFYVGVDKSEARVAVIEGKVNVSNELGAVLLIDNEAATARKGQAPQKTLTIKPRDAVQWALYYPPLFDPRSKSGAQSLSQAHELYGQGKITEAIESLNAVPEAERNGDFYSYRAGLLLLVGRADEAEPDIETALRENGNNADALSLKAIIAIVKNDKAKALELANQATIIDDKSASARIALSYALQANFKIEDALKAAQEATLRDADNALAWARVAELELSIPNYDRSKQAAERAVKINPNLARTQSILGFANLTRIEIKEAKINFSRAIELDQADPLPRLGLGLATIREGRIEQGREQIEIAASLDPENSLIRSYLGKAYYEEKRDDKAAKQFDLAKERDPNDPTPYLYDAIRKQVEIGPVDALKDLEKSISLNGNRAIYRSNLLLDTDESLSTASISAIFGDLGFEKLSLAHAAKSVEQDPGSQGAHWLLSGAYGTLPRHDIARVSEALQAKLRTPVESGIVDPYLSEQNLGILTGIGLTRPGINEYGALFRSAPFGMQLKSVAGNLGTRGTGFTLQGRHRKFRLSANVLDYETDGFNANESVKKSNYGILAQIDPAPSLSFQFEFTNSKLSLDQNFYPFDLLSTFPMRTNERVRRYRAGIRFEPDPQSELLLSAIKERRNFLLQFLPDETELTESGRDSHEIELQFRSNVSNGYWLLGIGSYRQNEKFPIEAKRVSSASSNAYVERHFGLRNESAEILVGASWEKIDIDNTNYSGRLHRTQLTPRLGFIWSVAPQISLRAGYGSTIKRPLVGGQTLQPTQIVGFNQFFSGYDNLFGELDGSYSNRLAFAIDGQTAAETFWGIEVAQRKLNHPIYGASTTYFQWKERGTQGYFYHVVSSDRARKLLPGWQIAAGIEYEYERLDRPAEQPGAEGIINVTTQRIPIGLKFFMHNRWVVKLAETYVDQRGQFTAGGDAIDKVDNGWITDLAIEYRFARGSGSASIGCSNLLDSRLDLFNTDPVNPRIALRRLMFGRLTLSF